MLASRSSRSFVMKSSADCFSRTRIESVAAFFFSASPAASSPIRSSRATSDVRAASSSRCSASRARDSAACILASLLASCPSSWPMSTARRPPSSFSASTCVCSACSATVSGSRCVLNPEVCCASSDAPALSASRDASGHKYDD